LLIGVHLFPKTEIMLENVMGVGPEKPRMGKSTAGFAVFSTH
jgi:hypothetical protein